MNNDNPNIVLGDKIKIIIDGKVIGETTEIIINDEEEGEGNDETHRET